MPAFAALLLPALLLSAPARAKNDLAERVDKELAKPALDEVSKAAKDLGKAGSTTAQPTWGAWAKMPRTPGVRQLLKFIDDELIEPIFRGANAGGVARALGSSDAGATAAQGGGGGFNADAFNAKVMKLVGFGTADPLSLDLASSQVVGKKVAAPGQPPKEARPDSLKFVRGRGSR